jgi:hypothetical protein
MRARRRAPPTRSAPIVWFVVLSTRSPLVGEVIDRVVSGQRQQRAIHAAYPHQFMMVTPCRVAILRPSPVIWTMTAEGSVAPASFAAALAAAAPAAAFAGAAA